MYCDTWRVKVMSLFPDGFCKIEKSKWSPGYNLPVWINLPGDKINVDHLNFKTLYAAKKFKKTHKVINGKMEAVQE